MLVVAIKSVMLSVVIMLNAIILSVVMLVDTVPSASATKKKVFFSKLEPAENVVKRFCPSFTNFRNKLECLCLASFSSLV
jgi:hypothetical protein